MYEKEIKLVLWGNPSVGKTSIMEMIHKRAPLHSLNLKHQFCIPMAEKKALNRKKISKSLRAEFEKNHTPLSKDARVDAISGSLWDILDKDARGNAISDRSWIIRSYETRWYIWSSEHRLHVFMEGPYDWMRRVVLNDWGDIILEASFACYQGSYLIQWIPGATYSMETIIPHLLQDARGILWVMHLREMPYPDHCRLLEENLLRLTGCSLSSFPVVICYNEINSEPVFCVPIAEKEALNQQKISESLRKEFEKHKIFLPQNPAMIGGSWRFTDIEGKWISISRHYVHNFRIDHECWEKFAADRIDKYNKLYNPYHYPWFATSAREGYGIFPAFRKLMGLVKDFEQQSGPSKEDTLKEAPIPFWRLSEEKEEPEEEEPEKKNRQNPPSEAGIEDLFG